MKTTFYRAVIALPTLLPLYSKAQSWATSGNTGSSGLWLGTNNSFPLTLKTNNIERMVITANGIVKFPALAGTGTGISTFNNDGALLPLYFTGTGSDVLTGTGSFASMSSLSGWTLGSGKVTTTNKVGIGVTSPSLHFELAGDMGVSGSIYATHFIASDASLVQGQLSFTGNLFVNGYDPIAGTRNEVHTSTQDYYIQSETGYHNNVILGHGNNSKIGIGTNSPNAKLHVLGSSFFEGAVRMDSIQLGDSVVMKAGGAHMGVGPIASTTLFYYMPECINKGTAKSFMANKGFYSTWSDNGSVNMGHTGTHALIQSAGEGDAGVLKLNHFCGKDVAICTGTEGGNVYMTTATTGKVGIGTNTPEDKLQIKTGTFSITMGNALYPDLFYGTSYIGLNATRTSSNTWKTEGDGAHNGGAVLYSNVMGDVFISTIPHTGTTGQTGIADSTVRKKTRLFINGSNGHIGIGTTCTPYQLTLEGHIGSREMWVKTESWCDYVFTPEHDRMNLNELEQYINENKHLPNVPSAKEVIEKGEFSLGETSKIHLEKIEELTLYMIEMNKRIEQLEKENAELKKAINK